MEDLMREMPFWAEANLDFWSTESKETNRLINPQPFFDPLMSREKTTLIDGIVRNSRVHDRKIINELKSKLLEWEKVRHYPVDKWVTGWKHIVHVQPKSSDFRVKNCRFPADWEKISASLVSEKTAGETFASDCGYVLDVPSQSILSTDYKDIGSPKTSEDMTFFCQSSKRSLHALSHKCDIRCWVAMFSESKEVSSLKEFKVPDQILMEQKAHGCSYNELLLIGRKTSDSKLYSKVPRPVEVRAKAVYIVLSEYSRDQDEAWAKQASRLNCNIPIIRVDKNGKY